MGKRPPSIRLAGIRTSIPPGYLLGRQSPGTGDVELIFAPEIVRGGGVSGGGSGGTGTSRDAIVFDLGEAETVVAGTALYHIRVPYRFQIVNVKAELKVPTTTGDVVVDINYGAASLLTTKITIAAGQRTSMEVAAQPVWDPDIMGDDGILQIDVDDDGDGTAEGLKVQIIGYFTTAALTASGVARSLLGSVSQLALAEVSQVFGTIGSVLGEVTQEAVGEADTAISGTIVSLLGAIEQAAEGDVLTLINGTIESILGQITQLADGDALTPGSYSNSFGSGDRQGLIPYIGTNTWSGGGYFCTINGSNDNCGWLNSGQTGTIGWDFGPRKAIIDEIEWKQSGAASQGTYDLEASDDFSSWTSLTTGVNLGGSATTTVSYSNSTAYRFYRFRRTAGSTTNGPYVQEVRFKINADTIRDGYMGVYGKGSRTSIITGSASNVSTGGAPSWLNGTYGLESFFTNASASGQYVKFDFLSGVVLQEALSYQTNNTQQGVWQWQGSNDDTNWTDIGGNFTFYDGSRGHFFHTELNGNSTSYRYYRMLGVSGSTSNSPYQQEIQFSVV